MIRRLARILLLLAGFWFVANPAVAIDLNKLLDLGNKLVKMSSEVSTEEEVKIGSNLISGLLGAAPLVKDEKLQRYVNDVGYWIASRSSRPDLPWSFGVIDSHYLGNFFGSRWSL